MHRILLATAALIMLAACATDEVSFKRMSVEELALYNTTVEVNDMIYCFDEIRTGSHIRKKYCASIAEIADALESDSQYLGVINYGGVGGFGRLD